MSIADRLRTGLVLLVLVLVTPPLMLLQRLAIRFGWRLAHTLPMAFHRLFCRLLRLRIVVEGRPSRDRPLLVLANHTSWLDIAVVSTLAPLSFIAKQEVSTWPVFGTLARLQRSIFIDRTRRKGAAEANREIAERLAAGDAIVLFAEGTTSDGNRVLPFRSAVVGAARDAIAEAGHSGHVVVQTLTIAYPRRGGLPVHRQDRPDIAWHGDMDLVPHFAGIISGPPIDAAVAWGECVAFDTASDRKAVTRRAQDDIRRTYARLVSGRDRD
ncbi:MAG: lysophospholipid acyltransferase family protein [Burkholderiales bacterium]|nr:lysophospholipid acyltransferase family protein [Burkholderiales bacterium]